ncbi:hypothetical protein [Planctomycetes bacterium K23_9]|uniref:hypothetical protein n=1 Tax=Stieleria marina TaxID=1930275 RepID=UPI00119FC248
MDRDLLYELLDDVIDQLADGRIAKDEAQLLMRTTIAGKMRSMWQCRDCNTIFVHEGYATIHSYAPDDGNDANPVFHGK